jgi:hypothetical protein
MGVVVMLIVLAVLLPIIQLNQLGEMSVSLDGKLVVAISSRALFDFEEENQIFEQGDDRAYMQLQRERLDIPAKPGVAFSLVKKLLAFNETPSQRVEVVILSRNDPVSACVCSGRRKHYALRISAAASPGAGTLALPQAAARQPVPVRPPERCARRTGCRRARCAGISATRPVPAKPTRSKCALPSTAMPCCSATRPSRCTRPRA